MRDRERPEPSENQASVIAKFKKLRGGKFSRVLIIPNLNVLNINLEMDTFQSLRCIIFKAVLNV